jgi:hypothetical protein
MRRALRTGKGCTWGPILIGLIGVGMVLAAMFTADPVDGFPPGTPLGAADHDHHDRAAPFGDRARRVLRLDRGHLRVRTALRRVAATMVHMMPNSRVQ